LPANKSELLKLGCGRVIAQRRPRSQRRRPFRLGEDAFFKIRPFELGSFEMHPAEAGLCEIRPVEGGSFEIRPFEAGVSEIRPVEGGSFEMRPGEYPT
jgi:hypothetical protein